MLGSFLFASLPLLALHASAAPGISNPLSLIKRAEEHEVVPLFARQTTYPAVGAIPPESSIPRAWLDRLSSLSLPNVPVATGTPLPDYPGRSKNDPAICSFTYECTNAEDLYAPPAGRLAFTFDDGPQAGTDGLVAYLKEQGAMGKVTHFLIGSFVAINPTKYQAIVADGGHVAVHTWSHQYMTTLTNQQVVAELGWCMQIIADNNGGRIPRYWRPPYGDVDNRVRAIAKGVFGLETVAWNRDTGDWNLDQGGSATVQSVSNQFIGWLNDKSIGLNVLEHEVRPSQVEVFKNVLPRARDLGWNYGNVADIWGRPWYLNAATSNSTVTPMSVGSGGSGSGNATSASSSSSSSSLSSVAPTTAQTTSAQTTSASTTSTSSATSNTAAAASASASRTSGGMPLIGQAGWGLGMVIPLLGAVVVLL